VTQSLYRPPLRFHLGDGARIVRASGRTAPCRFSDKGAKAYFDVTAWTVEVAVGLDDEDDEFEDLEETHVAAYYHEASCRVDFDHVVWLLTFSWLAHGIC